MPLFEKLTHTGNRSKLDSSFKWGKITHNFGDDYKNKPLVLNKKLVNSKMSKAETNETVLQHDVCDLGESTGDIFEQLHKNRDFTILKALSLPKFWETSPTAWFVVAENFFTCQNILSEQVKFYCVVNALEAKHIEKISHVLIDNNAVAPYQSLKQAILKTFEVSETIKLNKLLSLPAIDLGQNLKRPTELLLEMRGLLGQSSPVGPVAESLLKQMFLDKLPSQIKVFLAAAPNSSLEELASKAVDIMQVSKPTLGQGSINSQITAQPSSSQESQNYNLTQMLINQNFDDKLNKLSESINKLQAGTYLKSSETSNNPCVSCSPARMHKPQAPRPQQYSNASNQAFRQRRFNSYQNNNGHRFSFSTRFEPTNQQHNSSNLCYYHTRFGKRARKYIPPCLMSNPKNVSGSPQQ